MKGTWINVTISHGSLGVAVIVRRKQPSI